MCHCERSEWECLFILSVSERSLGGRGKMVVQRWLQHKNTALKKCRVLCLWRVDIDGYNPSWVIFARSFEAWATLPSTCLSRRRASP